MRQETNKEIDLLLRRLSRRDGEVALDAETQIDERHLDADELSTYAQNALPAAARARYTAHLAECSTCRRVATELSLALGVTTAAAPVETVTPASGLKAFLASLFSPMVLRYAVPALGVIVVMVVGFVVLRQRQYGEQLVAQLDGRSAQAPVATAPGAAPAPAAEPPQDKQEKQRGDASGVSGASGALDTGGPSGPGETAAEKPAKTAAPEGATDSVAVTAAPAPTITSRNDAPSGEVRPVVASPTPAATPKSVALFQSEEAKKEAESRKDTGVKKETDAKRPAAATAQSADVNAAKEKQQANEPPRETVRAAGRIAKDGVDQDKGQAAPSSGAGVGAASANTRRRAPDSRDEAETRTVAGRKFRKDRGIWTDTAYDSPTRTVNMARGSEQFRALVADEPAIGTIAEQLDGEVIVVWKGRAYRIR
jgi:hypothetical protein